jgi:hypothetical protein
MRIVLKAEPPVCSADLPLEVRSMSASGLVVLSSGQVSAGLDGQLRSGQLEEGTALRFAIDLAGRTVQLQARLVWLELTDAEREAELEMIVDAGEESGWEELRQAMAEG